MQSLATWCTELQIGCRTWSLDSLKAAANLNFCNSCDRPLEQRELAAGDLIIGFLEGGGELELLQQGFAILFELGLHVAFLLCINHCSFSWSEIRFCWIAAAKRVCSQVFVFIVSFDNFPIDSGWRHAQFGLTWYLCVEMCCQIFVSHGFVSGLLRIQFEQALLSSFRGTFWNHHVEVCSVLHRYRSTTSIQHSFQKCVFFCVILCFNEQGIFNCWDCLNDGMMEWWQEWWKRRRDQGSNCRTRKLGATLRKSEPTAMGIWNVKWMQALSATCYICKCMKCPTNTFANQVTCWFIVIKLQTVLLWLDSKISTQIIVDCVGITSRRQFGASNCGNVCNREHYLQDLSGVEAVTGWNLWCLTAATRKLVILLWNDSIFSRALCVCNRYWNWQVLRKVENSPW